MARGGEAAGSCWKEGLAETASLEEVREHAGRTLMLTNGSALFKSWKVVRSAHQAQTKFVEKHKCDVAGTGEADQASVESLLKVGRACIVEALILHQLAKGEGAELKECCGKQTKELLRVGASSDLLHPAIYKLVQDMAAKK